MRHHGTACGAQDPSLPLGITSRGSVQPVVPAVKSWDLGLSVFLLQECPFPWQSVQYPHAAAITADQPCDAGNSTAPERWRCPRGEAAAKQQHPGKEEQAASTKRTQVRLLFLCPVFVEVALVEEWSAAAFRDVSVSLV